MEKLTGRRTPLSDGKTQGFSKIVSGTSTSASSSTAAAAASFQNSSTATTTGTTSATSLPSEQVDQRKGEDLAAVSC
eukprot:GSA25T00026594001.1